MTMLDQSALSLEISRHFDASPERLFDAWLTEEWAAWLPPNCAEGCELAFLEPRVGGKYLVHMAMADGRKIEISGTYLEIERPKKIVLTWTGNYNQQETIIVVTFRPHGEGTLMTLRQDGFLDIGQRDGYTSGWTGSGGSFDKLTALVTRPHG